MAENRLYRSEHYAGWQTMVSSAANPQKAYTVRFGLSEYENDDRGMTHEWSCTCGDFVHRKVKRRITEKTPDTERYCKHIQYIRSLPVEEGGCCTWEGTTPEVCVDYDIVEELTRQLRSLEPGGLPKQALYAAQDIVDNARMYVPGVVDENGNRIVALPYSDLPAKEQVAASKPTVTKVLFRKRQAK